MHILRGLGSRLLGCGCLVGVYETYNGAMIAMIDAVGPRCTDGAHRMNAVVDPPERVAVPAAAAASDT